MRVRGSRLDVDVALTEIVQFLQTDERLPVRTRKAVQFMHGLRQKMVHQQKHASHPELFDCPLSAAAAKAAASKASAESEAKGGAGSPTSVAYTFGDVRSSYGDAFQEHFWPVFGAFNCMLPAHAPEPDAKAAGGKAAGVSSMMPP